MMPAAACVPPGYTTNAVVGCSPGVSTTCAVSAPYGSRDADGLAARAKRPARTTTATRPTRRHTVRTRLSSEDGTGEGPAKLSARRRAGPERRRTPRGRTSRRTTSSRRLRLAALSGLRLGRTGGTLLALEPHRRMTLEVAGEIAPGPLRV